MCISASETKLTTVIMKRLSILFTSLLLYSGTAMAAVYIIPKPTSVVEREGLFRLKDGMTIGYNNPVLAPAAAYLQELLTQSTGFSFKTKAGKGKIQLHIALPDENDESYELASDKKGVLITAHSYSGIINGIATLRQLLPVKVQVPCGVPAPLASTPPAPRCDGHTVSPFANQTKRPQKVGS